MKLAVAYLCYGDVVIWPPLDFIQLLGKILAQIESLLLILKATRIPSWTKTHHLEVTRRHCCIRLYFSFIHVKWCVPYSMWLSLISYVLNYILEANSNVQTSKNTQPLKTCMMNDWEVYAIPQQNVDNLDKDNLKTQINGRIGRVTDNTYCWI